MKTLYDAQGKKKLVEITAREIVVDTDYAWMIKDRSLSSKIIRMYFAIVRRTVLAGYDWTFPNGMKLSIRMKRKFDAHGIKWKDGEPVKVYNTRRPNEQYSIEMFGGPLKAIGYLFDPSQAFKTKMSFRLFNTDTPYSTIAGK